jgi:hypothetical protein
VPSLDMKRKAPRCPCWRLGAVVPVPAYVVIMILAVLCFGAFALHKMNPDKLRIYGESKLAKFGLEISRSGKADKPRDDRRELEAGRDSSGSS